jgi:hypothetical protein
MQPTMSPTAADANPPAHPTDLSNERPITTTTNTVDHKALESSKTDAPPGGNALMDKAAGILPASVIGAAAAYLRMFIPLLIPQVNTYTLWNSRFNDW